MAINIGFGHGEEYTDTPTVLVQLEEVGIGMSHKEDWSIVDIGQKICVEVGVFMWAQKDEIGPLLEQFFDNFTNFTRRF